MEFADIHSWYLFSGNTESQAETVADEKALTLINPRRACAARVTVVWFVCLSVG